MGTHRVLEGTDQRGRETIGEVLHEDPDHPGARRHCAAGCSPRGCVGSRVARRPLSTRSRTSGLTPGSPLTTRDTVLTLTPAASATSRIVARERRTIRRRAASSAGDARLTTLSNSYNDFIPRVLTSAQDSIENVLTTLSPRALELSEPSAGASTREVQLNEDRSFVLGRSPARRRHRGMAARALVGRLRRRSGDSTTRQAGDAASGGSTDSAASGEKVGVTLITKDSTNPFFVAMQKGAKADAEQEQRRADRRLRQAGG
jgi:hypothetical protein